MFLPDGSKQVKQIRFPKLFLHFLLIALLASIAVLTWVIPDYRRSRSKMPLLAKMQKLEKSRKRQFVHLGVRINRLSQKLEELNDFDRKLKIMVNLEVNDDNSPTPGIGGSDPTYFPPEYFVTKNDKALIQLMNHSLDDLNNEIALGKRQKNRLYELFENQQMLLASTPSIWPTKGWLSSNFGKRSSPFTEETEFHKGIDISAKMRTPIISPADGIVLSTRRDRWSGNLLTINHGYGIETVYIHLHESLVKKGQYVKRGETIALVGNTGRSTGPHLHYEVHLNGLPVNPINYVLN